MSEERRRLCLVLDNAIRHAAMLRWENVTIQAPDARAIREILRDGNVWDMTDEQASFYERKVQDAQTE